MIATIFSFLQLWTTGFFHQFFSLKGVKYGAIFIAAIGISSASVIKQSDDKDAAQDERFMKYLETHAAYGAAVLNTINERSDSINKRMDTFEHQQRMMGDQVNIIFQKEMKSK